MQPRRQASFARPPTTPACQARFPLGRGVCQHRSPACCPRLHRRASAPRNSSTEGWGSFSTSTPAGQRLPHRHSRWRALESPITSPLLSGKGASQHPGAASGGSQALLHIPRARSQNRTSPGEEAAAPAPFSPWEGLSTLSSLLSLRGLTLSATERRVQAWGHYRKPWKSWWQAIKRPVPPWEPQVRRKTG